MRRLVATVASLAALALAGSAVAATPLAGIWRATVSGKSAQLNGTWYLAVDQKGIYAVAKAPNLKQALIAGVSAVNGSNAAFADKAGPLACKGAAAIGYYTFTVSQTSLRLTVARDRCAGRAAVLGSAPFTKVR